MTQDINQELSDYIRMMRAKHKVSQEELAERIGISRTAYINWEKRPYYMPLSSIDKLFKELNEDILFFFNNYATNKHKGE